MIDIKTLTIGSHVLVGGKRVKVCGITRKKVGYHENGKPYEHLRYARLNEVEPIPITDELLEEIGFDVTKGTSLWQKTETSENVTLSCAGFLRIDKSDFYKLTFRERYKSAINITCRYLHEAEAFLALNGVELIKE